MTDKRIEINRREALAGIASLVKASASPLGLESWVKELSSVVPNAMTPGKLNELAWAFLFTQDKLWWHKLSENGLSWEQVPAQLREVIGNEAHTSAAELHLQHISLDLGRIEAELRPPGQRVSSHQRSYFNTHSFPQTPDELMDLGERIVAEHRQNLRHQRAILEQCRLYPKELLAELDKIDEAVFHGFFSKMQKEMVARSLRSEAKRALHPSVFGSTTDYREMNPHAFCDSPWHMFTIADPMTADEAKIRKYFTTHLADKHNYLFADIAKITGPTARTMAKIVQMPPSWRKEVEDAWKEPGRTTLFHNMYDELFAEMEKAGIILESVHRGEVDAGEDVVNRDAGVLLEKEWSDREPKTSFEVFSHTLKPVEDTLSLHTIRFAHDGNADAVALMQRAQTLFKEHFAESDATKVLEVTFGKAPIELKNDREFHLVDAPAPFLMALERHQKRHGIETTEPWTKRVEAVAAPAVTRE